MKNKLSIGVSLENDISIGKIFKVNGEVTTIYKEMLKLGFRFIPTPNNTTAVVKRISHQNQMMNVAEDYPSKLSAVIREYLIYNNILKDYPEDVHITLNDDLYIRGPVLDATRLALRRT